MQALFRNLETHLSRRKRILFKTQHRDGASKRQFNLAGSFKVGTGSTQPGHLAHVKNGKANFIKHPFKNTGVFIEKVVSQYKRGYIKKAQKKAHRLASYIFQKIDPELSIFKSVCKNHTLSCNEVPNKPTTCLWRRRRPERIFYIMFDGARLCRIGDLARPPTLEAGFEDGCLKFPAQGLWFASGWPRVDVDSNQEGSTWAQHPVHLSKSRCWVLDVIQIVHGSHNIE